jgi:hypothetical protein
LVAYGQIVIAPKPSTDEKGSCGNGPIATAEIEDVWNAPEGANSRRIWTFCDGVSVLEVSMEFEAEKRFQDVMRAIEKEAILVRREEKHDKAKKLEGSTYLFSTVGFAERRWIFVLRRGLKTNTYRSASLVHIQLLANSRECSALGYDLNRR